MPISRYIPTSALARPGVCTSSTRPASPYEGQFIYETDTDKTYAWNGSAWVEQFTSTVVDAKGDLIVGTANNAVSRLAAGANGRVLTAASGEATGLSWGVVAPATKNSTATGSLYPAVSSGTAWQSWPATAASFTFNKQVASTALLVFVSGSFYKNGTGNVGIGVNVGGTYYGINYGNFTNTQSSHISGSYLINGIGAGNVTCTLACRCLSGTIEIYGSEHGNTLTIQEVTAA